MTTDDTIIAFSSIPAASARIIVRLSGTHAIELAASLIDTSFPGPQVASTSSSRQIMLQMRGLRFPAWLHTFHAPRSYTGEDVIELHLPGNVLLARWVLDELVQRGARPAEPGEFTARAYFNGRMDLSEAEGVAATISAGNERELLAARRLLGGELAKRLTPIMDQLAETLALTEVGIDFSQEDVTFLSTDAILERLKRLDNQLEDLVAQSGRFAQLSHEPRIVLAGRPNAGKSTLLNKLAGRQRAVVSPVAGTTRDLLSAEVALKRGMVVLIDAAGVEDSQSIDPIAQAMRRRALEAIEQADVVLLLQAADDERPPLTLPRESSLTARSKGDLIQSPPEQLTFSAVTGQGLDKLLARLDALAFGPTRGGDAVALNDRHLGGIQEARAALQRARDATQIGEEVLAMELREALDALGAILGAVAPDELLGRIFSKFCIGK